MEQTAVVISQGSRPIDLAIAAWLDSKRNLSGSARTVRAYQDTLLGFRSALQRAGYDLDSQAELTGLILQRFAKVDNTGREVAPATFNHRLAVISSFYRFARKRGLLLLDNPAEQIERAKVQAYANAQPLQTSSIAEAMRRIDRGSMAGQRDYALLSVALATGRRVAELAALTWGDVRIDGQQLTLTWRHCKGGKVMYDTLPRAISRDVLDYLSAAYGAGLGALALSAPLWIALDKVYRGHALTARAISDICLKRLGVSKVHTTRHTFAHTMEKAGAKVSEIQARLGHASMATTGRYLATLNAAENPHAETLAALFGLA
ncbi:MAG TPA: tyrosine-type recombinase/integrase [Ktedonobacterales bacterium]|nr:tyrosine-type recombinase/integrase [Ktedonobacterales bacterium]